MNPAREAGSSCLVLGYDRTDSARSAASWAANELPPDGRLVIVHACRPLHAPPPPFSTAEERHALGRAIVDELFMDGEDLLGDIDLQAEISDDDPVSALIVAAQSTMRAGSSSAASTPACTRPSVPSRASC